MDCLHLFSCVHWKFEWTPRIPKEILQVNWIDAIEFIFGAYSVRIVLFFDDYAFKLVLCQKYQYIKCITGAFNSICFLPSSKRKKKISAQSIEYELSTLQWSRSCQQVNANKIDVHIFYLRNWMLQDVSPSFWPKPTGNLSLAQKIYNFRNAVSPKESIGCGEGI